MSSSQRTIAVVTPCFNDADSAVELIGAIRSKLGSSLVKIYVVDDGSEPAVASHPGLAGDDVTVLRLVRNMGHQRAIAVGLAYAVETSSADTFVIMDSDGEDKPTDVARLIAALPDDRVAVAVAERHRRSEGLRFATMYFIYRMIFHALTGTRLRFGNFSAMPQAAARRLVSMSELWFSISGTILRSRLPVMWVPTSRGKRFFGTSRMDFSALVLHGMGALAVFADRVITRMIIASFSLAGMAMVASLVAIGLKLVDMATPGWLTTVLGNSILLFCGSGLVCLTALFSTITGGAALSSSPSATYRSFLAEPPREETGGADVAQMPQRGPKSARH